MTNTIIFLAILSILIFIHELGHFLMARREGIRVEKFSLGFGPKLGGVTFKETHFCICAIPFGGYVKMAGDTRKEHTGKEWEYFSKSPGQRARVVFCGPLFNYFLAIFFLWIVYCIGYPQMSARVGMVMKDMPAAKAGIKTDDVIIAVNGKPIRYWSEVLENIKEKNIAEAIRIRLLRDGTELELFLTPQQKEEKDLYGKTRTVSLIGIGPSDDVVYEKYNIVVSFGKSIETVLKLTWSTLRAIISLIVGNLALKEAVTGPIGIFAITKEAARLGLNALVHVTAMLSLALAIFNVLPIPVLDGGHLLFLGIEKVRRKPLNEKVEQKITDVGFGFIMILAVFILFNDLIRYGYWDKINDWLVRWHTQ